MDEPFDAVRYAQRDKLLRSEQESWRMHWHDIAEFLAPRRGRYLNTDTDNFPQNGRKRGQKIINGTASSAIRTCGAGLQSGLTSPARPWFELSLPDADLAAYEPVKLWLEACRDLMLGVFAGSNFYSSNHTNYEEVSVFGTAAMLIDSDFKTVINCRPFTIGEYCLGLDAQYRPDTLYRRFSMAVSQMLQRFGPVEKLPLSVQMAVNGKRWDQRFEVLHVIEPAAMTDQSKADYRGMPFHSCYMLRGQGQDGILRKGGYKTLPFCFSAMGRVRRGRLRRFPRNAVAW